MRRNNNLLLLKIAKTLIRKIFRNFSKNNKRRQILPSKLLFIPEEIASQFFPIFKCSLSTPLTIRPFDQFPSPFVHPSLPMNRRRKSLSLSRNISFSSFPQLLLREPLDPIHKFGDPSIESHLAGNIVRTREIRVGRFSLRRNEETGENFFVAIISISLKYINVVDTFSTDIWKYIVTIPFSSHSIARIA